MASRILASASSRVFPCEMPPRRVGRPAIKIPASSCSINTRNRRVMSAMICGASLAVNANRRLALATRTAATHSVVVEILCMVCVNRFVASIRFLLPPTLGLCRIPPRSRKEFDAKTEQSHSSKRIA